jgi:hypothetical protein
VNVENLKMVDAPDIKVFFFFKFGLEVGVEKSIVTEPLVLKTLISQIAD